jgi:hypothetical protein
VACRPARADEGWRPGARAPTLALGRPLPTLPLAENLAVPLGLEAGYEEASRVLRIA